MLTNYLQSTKVHDCNNLRIISQEFTPLRLDRRTASPLKLDAMSSHLFANKLKWKIKNDSKTALNINFYPRLSENRGEASCSLDVGAFSALWEEKKNMCAPVLLADITSLNVALGFWEGTGKTWKQRLCFLPLGFCGLSLLTGSCRHFGYARREWQPHWSAFPEVEGKSKQTGKTLVVYHRRSCFVWHNGGASVFWMRPASWSAERESSGSANTKMNLSDDLPYSRNATLLKIPNQ